MRDNGEALGGKVMPDCDGSPTADPSPPRHHPEEPSCPGRVTVLRYGPQFSRKRMYVAPELRATRRSFDHRRDSPRYAGSHDF